MAEACHNFAATLTRDIIDATVTKLTQGHPPSAPLNDGGPVARPAINVEPYLPQSVLRQIATGPASQRQEAVRHLQDSVADLVLQLANANALVRAYEAQSVAAARVHVTTEISLGLDTHTHARCTACCADDAPAPPGDAAAFSWWRNTALQAAIEGGGEDRPEGAHAPVVEMDMELSDVLDGYSFGAWDGSGESTSSLGLLDPTPPPSRCPGLSNARRPHSPGDPSSQCPSPKSQMQALREDLPGGWRRSRSWSRPAEDSRAAGLPRAKSDLEMPLGQQAAGRDPGLARSMMTSGSSLDDMLDAARVLSTGPQGRRRSRSNPERLVVAHASSRLHPLLATEPLQLLSPRSRGQHPGISSPKAGLVGVRQASRPPPVDTGEAGDEAGPLGRPSALHGKQRAMKRQPSASSPPRETTPTSDVGLQELLSSQRVMQCLSPNNSAAAHAEPDPDGHARAAPLHAPRYHLAGRPGRPTHSPPGGAEGHDLPPVAHTKRKVLLDLPEHHDSPTPEGDPSPPMSPSQGGSGSPRAASPTGFASLVRTVASSPNLFGGHSPRVTSPSHGPAQPRLAPAAAAAPELHAQAGGGPWMRQSLIGGLGSPPHGSCPSLKRGSHNSAGPLSPLQLPLRGVVSPPHPGIDSP